jgi:hypothetical protein
MPLFFMTNPNSNEKKRGQNHSPDRNVFWSFVYVKWLKSSLMEAETFQFYNVAEVLLQIARLGSVLQSWLCRGVMLARKQIKFLGCINWKSIFFG